MSFVHLGGDKLIALILAGTLATPPAISNAAFDGVRTCGPPEMLQTEMRSIGYLAYWDQKRGLEAFAATKGAIAEVSPTWYSPVPGGQITLQDKALVDDSPAVVTRIREHNALIVPAIANYRDGKWNGFAVDEILADPATTRRHVAAIVDLVVVRDFDGIDVDYEHLPATSRRPFAEFASMLADQLHKHGKLLSVTLHPKSGEPGPQEKNQAQDYAAIGSVADEVRVMLYDYHWDTSERGPIAPVRWVRSVMEFAVTQIPREKLVLGLATYGYDWVGDRGESLMWQEIRDLAHAHDADIQWDDVNKSPWFTYTDDHEREHHVWFEDARSLRAKMEVAYELCVGKVHYWRLGGNDPAIWPTTR